MRPRVLLGALVVLVVAAVAVLPAGCRSLSKDELATRLAGLPRNAHLAAFPLQRGLALDVPGVHEPQPAVWLHVPAAASDKGPPVVLVHGTPGTLYGWGAVILGHEGAPGLAARHDVWALELPDHGLSPASVRPSSFARLAAYLAAFLQALDRGPVVLVGHSYGGEVAWRAALDHPELVSHLVLVDSAGVRRADDEWLPEEEAMRDLPGATLGWLLNSRERIATALQPHFDELPEGLVEEIFLVCENADNWGAMVELARDENGTREDELPRLTVPTLLVWGEDDGAYSVERFARRFEQAIPGARLEVLPGCGHYPPEEQPLELVRLLEAFVAD